MTLGPKQLAQAKKMMNDPTAMLDMEPVLAILNVIANVETSLQESAGRAAIAHDVDSEIEVHDVEERVEMLRAGLQASMTGTIPQTWVKYCSDLENAEEAAEFANIDAEDWEQQCDEWATKWRDSGLEGTDEQLAEAHIRQRYDVDKATFEETVVEWEEARAKEALEEMLAGPMEDVVEQVDAVAEEGDPPEKYPPTSGDDVEDVDG